MKIRYFLVTAVLATAILCFSATPASALTQTEMQALIAQIQVQIQSLLQQIIQLQAQQGSNTSTPSGDWCHTFNINLGFSSSGSSEVGYLHTALDKQGISYSPDSGNTYSEATAAGVVEFQEKYASETLASYGLAHGTGYVGVSTRNKLNSLYKCGATPTPTPTQECTPNWQCTGWTSCKNNIQNRTCSDSNGCGVTTDKPSGLQSCAIEESVNGSCSDSDGGKDYYTKGIITYKSSSSANNSTMTDTCSGYNNKYVREYYCDTSSGLSYGYKDYECSNGCSAGACKQASGGTSSVTLISPTIGGQKFELGKYVQITWSVHPPVSYWSGDLPVYESISSDYSLYATLAKDGVVVKKEKTGALNMAAQKSNYTASYSMAIPLDKSYLGDDYKISLSCDPILACNAVKSDYSFSIIDASSVYFTSVPVISSLSPSVLYKGQSTDITITGSYFTGADKLPSCGISASLVGLKVNSCQLVGGNTIKANVTISDTATIGTRYLSISDGKINSNKVNFAVSLAGCSDADGGLSYYSGTSKTEGLASWTNTQGTFFDTCTGSTLREYYCSNDKVYYKDYVCPGGCTSFYCNPYIKVLSPNGAESFKVGGKYTINWESLAINSVNIILWGPNGNQHIANIVPSADGPNSYSWTVDSKMVSLLGGAGSQYYISVVGTCYSCTSSPQDKSDSKFTIQ